jgi:hypothetical protein
MLMEMIVISLLLIFLAMELYKEQRQVRKTAGWPGSWANFSCLPPAAVPRECLGLLASVGPT